MCSRTEISSALGRCRSRNMAPGLEPGKIGETVGNSSFYLNETLLPQRDKGRNQHRHRKCTGTARPSRARTGATTPAHDAFASHRVTNDMAFPGSGGSITVDEVRIFQQLGQRYNWNIVGTQKSCISPAPVLRGCTPVI